MIAIKSSISGRALHHFCIALTMLSLQPTKFLVSSNFKNPVLNTYGEVYIRFVTALPIAFMQ